ncbi:MAG TPA: C-type lectin domain-containing protein, partial [Chthoniobacteraceae bacterium]
NGKWYRVYLEKGGWRHAKQQCNVLGGQLVVIPDEATQNFVKQLAGVTPLWIGATDEKLKGVWVWVDGTTATYTAWEPGQPNGAPKEDYMAIWHGLWNDAFENEPKVVGFVCEWSKK